MALTLAPIEGTPFIGGNPPGFQHIDSAGKQRMIKSNLTATTDPTSLDGAGSGYSVGSRWINTVTGKILECVDNSVLAAVWKDLSSTSTPGGSTGNLQYNNGTFAGLSGSSVSGANLTLGGTLTTTGSVVFNYPGANTGNTRIDAAGTGSAARIYAYDGSGNLNVMLNTNGDSWLKGGNVGIGISSSIGANLHQVVPASTVGHRIDLNATATDAIQVNSFGNTGGNLFRVDSTGTTTLGGGSGSFRVHTDTTSGDVFTVRDAANTNTRFQIRLPTANTASLGVGGTDFITLKFDTINVLVTANASNRVPLVVRGSSGQTSNLQEWQNSGSMVLASISAAGGLSTPSLTVSGLTSGRIPFVSTGGLLADSATFVRDSSTGNVGIGTPLPSQLLQVMGGNIYTSGEIYTDSSVWADSLQARNANAITIKGRSLDGASAVSVVVDSVNLLSTTGAKLLSIRNSATEKAYIDKDGGAYFAGKILSGDDPFNAFNQYAHALYWNGVGAIYSSAIFLELDSTSHNQSRAISVWDKRTSTGNQPSIGVVSPNGENIFGLTWDGGNTVGIVNTFGAQDIAFAPNNTTAVTIKNGGNVAIGHFTDPSALIHGQKNSGEHLRLGYDATHYLSITDDVTGAATFAINAGSGATNAIKLDATVTASYTSLQVRDVDSGGGLQRVRVGANGTGPGGVGRALYMDNF